MRQVAVFNNKGGAGKSTLTVFLADFASSLQLLGSDRLPRILVMDLDEQASAAKALLGADAVAALRGNAATLSHLVQRLASDDAPALAAHRGQRAQSESDTRKTRLAPIDVMVVDEETVAELDERHSGKILGLVARTLAAQLRKEYDYAFVDFPARVRSRDHFAMAMLAASTHVVVPTEVTDIALNPLPDTFRVIDEARARARQLRGRRGPAAVGIVMNKNNKSFREYRTHGARLRSLAKECGTRVLESQLPPASQLMTATDGTFDYAAVRDKYDSYYDHVRKVAREVLRSVQQ